MQTGDLERIRFVTEHYPGLRGLYTVSLGLGFLSSGLLRTLSGTFRFLPASLLWVGSIALFIFANSYYYKTFGEVEERQGSKRLVRWAVLLAAILGILLVATTIVAVAGAALTARRFFYLLWGAPFVGGWIERKCRRSQSYYLVLGALLMALAAPGPYAGFLFPGLATLDLLEIFGGSALILAGLLDHWQLVHLLGGFAAAPQAASESPEAVEGFWYPGKPSHTSPDRP